MPSSDDRNFLDSPVSTFASTSSSPLFAGTAIVPGLFRRRSINLIVGKSKVGRMRLALTQLNNYTAARDPEFLEKPVPPGNRVQLGCIISLQDSDQLLYDLRLMGLDNLTKPGVLPIVRWHPRQNDETEPMHPFRIPYQRLQASEFCVDKPKFLLIENIQSFMDGDSTKQRDTTTFLDGLREFCEKEDCTILATVGIPKMLKGQGYASVPERIYGSNQWGEGTDTIIGVEEVRRTAGNGLSRQEAELYRRVKIVAAGMPFQQLWARFTADGRLVTVPEPESPVVGGVGMLDLILASIPAGTKLSRTDLHEWSMRAVVSTRTTNRWIKEQEVAGELDRVGHGMSTVYVKRRAASIEAPIN